MQPTKYQSETVAIKDHLFIIVFLNTLFMTVDFIYKLFANYSHKSMKTKIENVYMLNPFIIIYIIHLIICIFIVIMYESFLRKIQLNAITCMIYGIISIMFLTIIVQQLYSKAFTIDSINGLDCGTYMAFNYYYGYLKLIIPSTGTNHKGIIEKIENTEDQHNISIAVHKLLILIPASSYIPPDLKEASNRSMENVMKLEEEKRDRAGVKGRTYHNNVYKIYKDDTQSSFIYVVAEGATPLLTFFESQKHAHPETSIYKKYHQEIIKKFYEKLKTLIDDDPECKDLCELIYYEDYKADCTKVNVAQVILERLFQINKS